MNYVVKLEECEIDREEDFTEVVDVEELAHFPTKSEAKRYAKSVAKAIRENKIRLLDFDSFCDIHELISAANKSHSLGISVLIYYSYTKDNKPRKDRNGNIYYPGSINGDIDIDMIPPEVWNKIMEEK